MANKKEEIKRLLGDLISFDTSGYNFESMNACIDYVESYLSQYELYLERYESNGFPSIVASTRPGKSPHILLQAHLDVVPAHADGLLLKESDGKLFGRGTYDMKFAAASYLLLIEELKDDLKGRDFALMFTTDEEIGGNDGVGFLAELGYRPGVCIIPDGGNDWQIEERCNDVWITSLLAEGISSHGSRPWEGDNAIYKLIEALAEIRQLFGEQRPFKNSLTISQIQGGRAENQVPAKASASLDMRFTDHNQYVNLRKSVEVIAAKYHLKFGQQNMYDGRRVSLDHPEIRSFLRTAENYLGRKIEPTQSLGSSDAHFFAELGIPTIVIRPEGGAAHSDEEWISIDGLLNFHSVLKAYIKSQPGSISLPARLDNVSEAVAA